MATNDLNRVFLIGRLTRDPELRQTNGGAVCKFSIANNRTYTTKAGERREEVSFLNCVAWSRLAEIINQYCRRGKQVAVEGRITQRSWENQEGKKQSSVEIVVDQLQMLGAATGGDGAPPPDHSGGGGYAPPDPGYPAPQPAAPTGAGTGSFNEPVDEDDIPF